MPISAFLKRMIGAGDDKAYQVYGAVVAQARQPAFYADLGIADTVAGRYDLIILHAFLLFDRLNRTVEERRLAQQVIDVMFADLDRSLREMGVGDLSVPKKIKAMGGAFNGRSQAYEKAFETNSRTDMAAALARNLYPDMDVAPPAVVILADYAFESRSRLENQSFEQIVAEGPDFPGIDRAADR